MIIIRTHVCINMPVRVCFIFFLYISSFANASKLPGGALFGGWCSRLRIYSQKRPSGPAGAASLFFKACCSYIYTCISYKTFIYLYLCVCATRGGRGKRQKGFCVEKRPNFRFPPYVTLSFFSHNIYGKKMREKGSTAQILWYKNMCVMRLEAYWVLIFGVRKPVVC